MLIAVDTNGPTDAELLAAGGWTGLLAACVLAKGWDGKFCAAIVNSHGGDESNPYFTVLECFERGADGGWDSLGHQGPISRGHGSGSCGSDDFLFEYEYGWSDAESSWWVSALEEKT